MIILLNDFGGTQELSAFGTVLQKSNDTLLAAIFFAHWKLNMVSPKGTKPNLIYKDSFSWYGENS
jgi:hypothetical protein